MPNQRVSDFKISALFYNTDSKTTNKLKEKLNLVSYSTKWQQPTNINELKKHLNSTESHVIFFDQTAIDLQTTKSVFEFVKKNQTNTCFVLLTGSDIESIKKALELTKLGVDECIIDNDYTNIESIVLKLINKQKKHKTARILTEVNKSINEISTTGGWHYDVINRQVKWTSITKKIHEVKDDYEPEVESSINFYKEGWSRETISQAVKNASLKGESYDLELILITAKGTEKWIRTIGKPIIEDGKCIYLYGTIEDITSKRDVKRNLKITNQRLSTLLNNLRGSIIQYKISKNGKINVLFASNQIEELHEISPKSVIGDASKLAELVHPKHQERITSIILDAIKHKKEYTCTYLANTKTKEEKWIKTIGVPFFDDDGTFLYNVISWDITQEINKEKELETLSLVAKKTTNCIIITDKNGLTEWVNDEFTKFSGYEFEEIIGRKPGSILQGQDTDPKHVEYLRKCIHEQKSGYCEILNYHKNGTPYWVEIYLTPIFSENGELQKFIAIQNDVTKRKFHDERLNETNLLLNEAIDELKYQKFALDEHSIVAITDVKGTIIYANKKFCELSKYSHSELLNQNHRILNSGEHSKAFFKEMYSTIANGKTWHGEIKNKAKDGSFYWVDTTIVPFVNQKNYKVEKYVSIRTDITDQKRHQHKLIQINNKYEQVLQATNDAIWEWDIDEDTLTGFNMFSNNKNEILSFSDAISTIHIDDQETVKQSILDSIGNSKVFQWEQEYRMPNEEGKIKYIYDRAQISRDSNGKAFRIIGAKQDNTDKMVYLKRLKIRNERLMQIAWTQSHETRAPLANILGVINLMNMINLKDEEFRIYIQALEDSAKRMDSVIKNIVESAQFIEDEEF